LNYQWFKGAGALPGETGSSLTLNNLSAANAGTYSVVVGGVCGSPVTNSASLTVNENVAVSSAPVNLTNCPGTSASFSVTASGTGPLTYQWAHDGTPLSGQSDSSLAISNITAASAGTYSVEVAGVCSRVTNSATLTVNVPTTANA